MGIWGLSRRHTKTDAVTSQSTAGSLGRTSVVAAAGIGLSGENVAVFVPFFSRLSATELAIVVGLYLFSAAIVFVLAVLFTRRITHVGMPTWVNQWLVPIVLSLVGVYILVAGWFLG